MIYKIYNSSLTEAMATGATIVTFSFDGMYVLVRSDSELKGALELYNESEISSLYKDPLYKQPCKDCE